jgi:predicted RNA-binding Zn-ribbon protein involved in translation (DUF1610 family)
LIEAKCSECGTDLTPDNTYVDDLCKDCMQESEEEEEARMMEEAGCLSIKTK